MFKNIWNNYYEYKKRTLFPRIEDSIWEPNGMKVYALKYKNDIVKMSTLEYDVSADYRWDRDEVKKHLTVVYGTFTEEGTIERLITEEKEVV